MRKKEELTAIRYQNVSKERDIEVRVYERERERERERKREMGEGNIQQCR